jgi:outer membrane receptor for Fe3+-dicitrate
MLSLVRPLLHTPVGLMIHSNSTPSTPAHKSKALRGFPSMNFTLFHRKVTPSFFSGSNSEASSSQTSLDNSSYTNARTTCSFTSSPDESTGGNVEIRSNSTVRASPFRRLFEVSVLI